MKKYKKFWLFAAPFLVLGIFYLAYPSIKYALAVWGSSITVCPDTPTEPACYSGLWATPTLNWDVTFPNREICDCDSFIPAGGTNDCPFSPDCNQVYANYELVVFSGSCGGTPVYSRSGGSVTSITVGSGVLSPHTKYCWAFRGKDALKTWTPWIPCETLNTNPLCVPTAPSNLSILTAYSCTTHRAGFTWTDNSSNESGFRLQRRPDGAGVWTTICSTGANDNTCAAGDLTENILDGANWDFRVEVWNPSGSAYSNTLDMNLPLCAPSNFTTNPNYDCSVHKAGFTWTDNSLTETNFIA